MHLSEPRTTTHNQGTERANGQLREPILYATVTLLAFNINERYYNGLHYMWCTPCFDVDIKSPLYGVPPTSSPFQIYKTLANEVVSGDLHSEKINANRVGIQRGALKKLEQKIISEESAKRIQDIAQLASINLFRPFLCVISTERARGFCTEVNVSAMASPLSQEFIVDNLPRSAFDIISIGSPA
jgi:hypothetical protein